jgi:hypothetical protein
MLIIVMLIIGYVIFKRVNIITLGRSIRDISTPVPIRRNRYSTQRDSMNEQNRFEAIFNVIGSRLASRS